MSRASSQLTPKVVLAGAGTGKTSSLIDEVFRVAKEFENSQGQKPRLVVCTFTRKAAHELKERLTLEATKKGERDFLEYIHSPRLFISTLHGLFLLLLRNYGWKTEINPDFHIISEKEEQNLLSALSSDLLFNDYLSLLEKIPFYHLSDVLKTYIPERFKFPDMTLYNEEVFKSFMEEYHLFQKDPSLSSSPKDLFKEKKSFEGDRFIPFFKEFEPMAQKLFPLWLAKKKREALFTPNDLELFLFDLINKDKRVLHFISKSWDYWFIDEYQDTSWIQEQIIKKITQFKNVFCVGDPGQSIYLFRHADPKVFARRLKEYGKEPIKLEVNHRSQTPLIWFFNDFFSSKPAFLTFKPPKPSSLEDSPVSSESPCVYFISYSSEDPAELTFKKILKHIQRLVSKGKSFKDIALLSARNEDLTALALFLTQRNIPLLTSTAEGFSKKRILLDCLFLYKFLINPWDTENLAALCRTPYFRISDERLSHIINSFSQKEKALQTKEQQTSFKNGNKNLKRPFYTKEYSLWEHCLKDFPREETVKTLKNLMKLKETLGLLPTFEKAIFQNIFNEANNLSDFTGINEGSIWKLLKHLYQRRYSQHHPLDFYYSFLSESLNNEEAMEAPPFTSSDTVKLLTIHGSKGLEFENVIVFNLSKSRSFFGSEAVYDSERNKMAFSVPDGERNQKKIKCHGHRKINKKQNEKRIEETDRLLYVAMTRAKNSLTLLVPEGKPVKNPWFERFTFFESFREKKEDGSWEIKEGLYKRENYSFLVERVVEKEKASSQFSPSSLPSKSSKVETALTSSYRVSSKPLETPQKKIQEQKSLSSSFKSSRDFIRFSYASEDTKDQPNIKITTEGTLALMTPHSSKVANTFIKAQLGSKLHDCLQLLGKESQKTVQKKLKNSLLFPEEKENLKEALDYVMNLQSPSLSFFLKKGFSEWAFKLQQGKVILQGQIDLWGWREKQIHLFDYKSSLSNRDSTKKQLAFYAYVLDQLYKPESVKCFGVYPFQKKTEEYIYSLKEKKEITLWLKSFE